MLYNYLKGAVENLDSLINLTRLDIEDIKKARHEAIFSRNEEKQPFLESFEAKKNLAQQEILLLKNKNPSSDISEILDQETSSLLADMKSKLFELKTINARYARIVLSVKEFYSSLIDQMFPQDFEDYSQRGIVKPPRAKSAFFSQEA